MSPVKAPRVVDLTDVTGAYAGRLLADVGADVVRVEPPTGDPLRSRPPFLHDRPGPDRGLWFAAMNAGKRSLAIDIGGLEAADRRQLFVEWPDIVLFSGTCSRFDTLGLCDLDPARDGIVLTTLTPFGRSGPLRSWQGNDLVAWATGGLAVKMGEPELPPVIPSAELACVVGAQQLTIGALAAVRHLRRTGAGSDVDVSLQESVTMMTGECGVPLFLDEGRIRSRTGSHRPISSPFGHFTASDGYIAILAINPTHWLALREWIYEGTGDARILDESFVGGPEARTGEKGAEVDALTEAFTRTRTRGELFEQGQARKIPVSPVNEPSAVLDDSHLASRNWWEQIIVDGMAVRAAGSPFRMAAGPSSRSLIVPSVGQDNDVLFGEIGLDR